MATNPPTERVEETIPKIDNQLAIGEDLEFQRHWWRFEHIVWTIFTIIIALDLTGLLGRGPLANAKDKTADGVMMMQYQRYERFETPGIMELHFTPAAVKDGKIVLWVSSEVIKSLGNQRVIPQPSSSVLYHNGILYTFPSSEQSDDVEFALKPASAGYYHFTVKLPVTGDQLTEHVVVYP